MKKVILCLAMLAIAISMPAQRQKVYDTEIDPMAQIDAAMKNAQATNRNIICQVGGNWCRWCLMLANFITQDQEIAQTIHDHYVYIHVNYSPESPIELKDRLRHPDRFGYPVLVVMDADGNVIHTQDSSFLESGEGYDREKVLRFLQAWTPDAIIDSKK